MISFARCGYVSMAMVGVFLLLDIYVYTGTISGVGHLIPSPDSHNVTLAPPGSIRPSKSDFVVGLCHPRIPPSFVKELSESAFSHDHNVSFLQLPDDGVWWPNHTMPNAIICMGWFYHKSIHQLRRSAPKLRYNTTEQDGILHWAPTARPLINRPFTVAFNTEPWAAGSCESYDVILDVKNTPRHSGCSTMLHTYGFKSLYLRTIAAPDAIATLHTRNISAIMARKQHLLAFISSKCDYSSYPIEASLRVSLFDTLLENLGNDSSIHAVGNCRRNTSVVKEPIDGISPNDWFDYPPLFYRSYKFVIAFENTHRAGYTTEKIFSALLGDSVPVYFGNPDIEEMINPKRFIHCHFNRSSLTGYIGKKGAERNAWVKKTSQSDLDKCMAKIQLVANNDTLYMDMLRQPVYPDFPRVPPMLDINTYGTALRKVYDATMALSQ